MSIRNDGAPDPLSAGQLREKIAGCEANIERMTKRGQHQFAAVYRERKQRYERRLSHIELRQTQYIPLMPTRQISDAKWRAMSEEEATT